MSNKQKTIAKKIYFNGFGFLSKKKINVTLNPAPENTGFLFRRIDLEGIPTIKFNFNNLFQQKIIKKIILENNGIKIYNTEHIIAAFHGMDLDNIIIELDNLEIPILDGCCKFLVDSIEKVGIIEQNIEKKYFSIKEVISIKNKINGELIAIPSNKLEIMIMIDFESDLIHSQNASLKRIDQFKNIYNSKIFCVLNKKKKFLSWKIDEIAKHFLIDIIGLLALIEVKLKGKIIIYNPDKFIIIEFLKILIKKIRILKNLSIFKLDLSTPPIFDINNIMKILPHKPPFLLVDKIVDLSEKYVIGIKNVTINESFFTGHFPDEPVMPGVLQIEAIAQVGGIFILNQLKNPKLYSTYLLKINQVIFKKKIVPGDIIILKVYLLKPIKIGIIQMHGIGYVGNESVVEAEIVAKIVKKKLSRKIEKYYY